MNTNAHSRFLRNAATAALLAGLSFGLMFPSRAADEQDDYAQKISQSHLFSQSVMWVGTTAPATGETSDLYVAMGLDPDRRVDRISSIEGFIQAHPDSPWTPSLRANLARYYRTIGRYSVALDYWQKAWDTTKDLKDANARQVADYTLAYWTDLLSSLGRVDKLKELIAAVGGRRMSNPQFQRMLEIANKAAAIMIAEPGQSFRCGSAALYQVAEVLQPQGNFYALLKMDSPATGFSIAQLAELSDQYHLGLVPVKRPSGSDLVVPSVIHWKMNHYAAIVERQNGVYKVVDPTFGRPQLLSAKTINENASGYFLVPTNQVPKQWQVVSKDDVKTLFGKGLMHNAGNPTPPGPNCDADGNPCTTGTCPYPCPPPYFGGAGGGGGGCGHCLLAGGGDSSGTSNVGMPGWQVNEPYISLWLHDRPMFYNMSFGRQFVLQVDYHQREVDDGRYDTNFGCLGINWNCNLLTYIKVDGAATVGTDYQTNCDWTGTNCTITPYPYSSGGFEATEYSPDGGQRVFDWGGTNVAGPLDPRTHVQFIPSITNQAVTNVNFLTPDDTFIGNNEFYVSNTLVYPNGSIAYFDQSFTNSEYPLELVAPITSAKDPSGHVMTYSYSLNSSGIVLSQLVDFDGKTNQFVYGNASFPSQITEITNINYGLAVHFSYDTNGFLTNIVDMGGICSSFHYTYTNDLYYTNDGYGNAVLVGTNFVWLLTEMTTPYGNTTFDYFQPTWPLFGNYLNNYINRAITVTQPDSGKHLFIYRDDAEGNNAPFTQPGDPYVSDPDFEANQTKFIQNSYLNSIVNDAGNENEYEVFENNESFYWGPRQYANLSTTVLTNLNYYDFLNARIRSWLQGNPENTLAISQTLNTEQQPAPDLSDSVLGETVWYAYEGEPPNYYYESTNDGLSAGFGYLVGLNRSYFNNISRNSLGYPTQIVAFGSVNETPTLNTNIYTYWPNNIDLSNHVDPYGVVQESYTYDGNHNVISVTDATNQTTTYTYNANGAVTSITRATGLVTTNIYGANGFLETTYNFAGSTYYGTNTYTYTNDLVLTHTDERGVTTVNTWDALHRITKVAYPDGTFVGYTYSNLDLVRVVDRLGYPTSYVYDSMRRRIAVTNALGNATVYNYCTCGSLDSIVDAQGHTNSFEYDNAGRLIDTTYADGFSVTNSYDFAGNILNISNSSGKSTDKFYDGLVRVIAISNDVPSSGQALAAAYSYDLNGLVTNQMDANGVTVNMTYDTLHRLTSRTYPDHGTESFGYTLNVSGMTSYTNQLTNVWTYAYDPRGLKTNEIGVNVYTNGFGYSRVGDLLSLTDGKGNTTSWNYDQFGRVTNKLDASSDVIFVYGYDDNNRLTNRWTPVTSNTVYAYDAVGNLTNIDYQQSPAIHFGYDSLNRLVNMLDAVGSTVYTYDPVGQLLSEDGPWSDDTVNYTYANRLRTSVSVNAPNASPWTQTYGYDALDRLTNVTSPAGAFGYNYVVNPATGEGSLIQSLNLPNGAYITNTFDGNARLTETALQNSSGVNLDAESYTYNQGNQRTEQTFTAGNFMNYTYDSIGELQTALGKEPGGITNRMHEQFGFTYDAAGNLNRRTNNLLIATFNVNVLNELTTIIHGGTLTVEGTTTSTATNVAVNTSNAVLYVDSTFASTNQPLVNSATNFFTAVAQDGFGRVSTNVSEAYFTPHENPTYDLNGNLVSETTLFGRNFAYDDENQLIAVWVTNNWMSQFLYDGKMRRRIRKEFTWSGSIWIETSEVHYVYDGNVVIQERDIHNLPQVTYTRGTDLGGKLQGAGGIGGLLARTDMGQLTVNSGQSTAFYHADGNGNITCLINTNQFIVAKYEYDPYGNILSQLGSLAAANVYRFSSKEYHTASGLIYYLYRFYDPNLQRWLNRDPILEKGGLNSYQFVLNSPSDVIDAYGLAVNCPKGTHCPPDQITLSIDNVPHCYCAPGCCVPDPPPPPPNNPPPPTPPLQRPPVTVWLKRPARGAFYPCPIPGYLGPPVYIIIPPEQNNPPPVIIVYPLTP